MNQSDFSLLVESTIANIQKLLVVKGGEYANSEDRLANFKRGAELTGTTPLQVAFIYLSKHYDGIASFVRSSAAGNVRPSSEPIEGRLDDLINYCLLIKALIAEQGDESVGDNPLHSSWVWHRINGTGTSVAGLSGLSEPDSKP